MFRPQAGPRVFAAALGQDFSAALHRGLMNCFDEMAPEEVAAVEVYVNTRRMARRLTDLFHQGSAMMLPRIRLVTDLSQDAPSLALPPATAPLRRKLEVAQLVKRLLETDERLASRDAAFDLADSLTALMSEMQGEGVSPDIIANLDVQDQSGHWDRALKFVNLVQKFFAEDQYDPEGRQRRIVEDLASRWEESPPEHPIIVAGSTGSRGSTALFMQKVAGLPQGAVVLPGFDRDMPATVWEKLSREQGGEDHPQFRFKDFCDALGLAPADLPPWADATDRNTARTALVSLSLRPAPVTHQWITEGPKLPDLGEATQDITLIEAPTPRAEAEAIALRMRQAIEEGETAALISPDRMLTRQVTAALDRWGVEPDDSAGRPLHLSAPGRFLRHVADLMTTPLTAEALLILLRHPLTASPRDVNTKHGLHTNALELQLRRKGPAFPDKSSLMAWAAKLSDKKPELSAWVSWVAQTVTGKVIEDDLPLSDLVATHLDLANTIAAGPKGEAGGALWQQAAGREALRLMTELQSHADAGGTMSARDYRNLLGNVLSGGEVRDRDRGHPQVLIWGTLEARVQSADLVILAGLNEGTWPEAAAPDPWLNRPMRKEAGLLLPERRIGLSAHDYQQAICAPKVVISRAVRSEEAETVPSRWLNRLLNLLGGLGEQGGPALRDAMRARGASWLLRAAEIGAPDPDIDVEPAKRPSPRPPVDARPDQLSVTQIKTLIRDPYAIYARKVLKLGTLDPLAQTADAPLRGTIVHKILERFIQDKIDPAAPDAAKRLMGLADEVLIAECPWPAVRTLWRERFAAVVPHFLADEVERQANATNVGTELEGEDALDTVAFTLTGTADRIDVTDDGDALIYDYKTGRPPSEKEQIHFDKQLLLEAAMVERGAFKDVGKVRTAAAVYIGLGSAPKNQPAPLKKSPAQETWARFESLMKKWEDPNMGYTSRRANQSMSFEGDYDHLARFGEWDETDEPYAEDME